jgi:hypothetical protein
MSKILMEPFRQNFIVGPWTTLPGGYGEDFAIDGTRIAGAQGNRLSIWTGTGNPKEIFSPLRECGHPRWIGSSVYWGDGWVDAESGDYVHIGEIDRAFIKGTNVSSTLDGPGNYVPATYAWAPDGNFVLASVSWIGEGSGASRVLLIHKDGTLKNTLWEGYELAPKAAWVGKHWIALGTRNPSIYDLNGILLASLGGKLMPERIEADEKETVLLIHSYDGVTFWNTQDWQRMAVIEGAWLDASISPDGGTAALIDFEGRLFITAIRDEKPFLNKVDHPDPLASVSIGRNCLVAAFSTGDPVRMAEVMSDDR